MTWPEAKARFDAGALTLLAIGAASKEHGRHLPLKTDYLLARELCRRVMEELPVVVAPIVTFGYFPAFLRYPGSQHLRAETFIALLRDILGKLIGDGVRHLGVINTGVSTEPPLRIVVRDLYQETGVRIHVADIARLGGESRGELSQKLGGHGDEGETSMILAIEPDSVDMGEARVDYGHMLEAPDTVFYAPAVFDESEDSGIDYSRTGVRGDPTLATAEKGERLLSTMAGELVTGLKELFPGVV